VAPLDGQCVRGSAPDLKDLVLPAEERASSWDECARRGPQGPIEDDEEPEFP